MSDKGLSFVVIFFVQLVDFVLMTNRKYLPQSGRNLGASIRQIAVLPRSLVDRCYPPLLGRSSLRNHIDFPAAESVELTLTNVPLRTIVALPKLRPDSGFFTHAKIKAYYTRLYGSCYHPKRVKTTCSEACKCSANTFLQTGR